MITVDLYCLFDWYIVSSSHIGDIVRIQINSFTTTTSFTTMVVDRVHISTFVCPRYLACCRQKQ